MLELDVAVESCWSAVVENEVFSKGASGVAGLAVSGLSVRGLVVEGSELLKGQRGFFSLFSCYLL